MAQNFKPHNYDNPAVFAHRRRRSLCVPEIQHFYYPNCTTHELEELEKLYGRRGYTVKKQLNPDCVTWFVSVELPVSNHLPHTPYCYRQRIWR
ncbi:putative prophage protein [Escherichia coli]|nr:putative prophage protein [Escherichia coli]CAD5748801.1 putative prophage protein [Escherichia coli]